MKKIISKTWSKRTRMKLTKGSTLDRFWKLSENKEKQRIDAALNIIIQGRISKAKNHSDFQDNLKYNLQRFVSGLASDRVTSRSGYFIGLVELLKTFAEEISVDHVFDLISKHLNVKGSKSVSIFPKSIYFSRNFHNLFFVFIGRS